MGRFMLNGKATMLNGNFVEYNNGTLAFTVSGASFPMSTVNPISNPTLYNSSYIRFTSSESNTAVIDYGDGNVINYIFKSNLLEFRLGTPSGDDTRQVTHTYTDGNSGKRIIRITFSKPDKIISMISAYIGLYDNFPNEISTLSNLNSIRLQFSNFIKSFPVSVALLDRLKELQLLNVGTAIEKRIPDEFIDINLNNFDITNSVDLSDVNSSNLKNFLGSSKRSSLSILRIDNCNMITMPDELENCNNLEVLYCGSNNKFETFPSKINTLSKLAILYIGQTYGQNPNLKYWSSFNNLNSLALLNFVATPNIETNLPLDLENCINLKNLNCEASYKTTARINAFITNLYNFINTNASKTGLNTLPFRGMTINCISSAGNPPTGTFQSPTGYVAGVSNGTPASPKEMLWVLINQYGHTITYTA